MGKEVLIVDDDPDMLEEISMLLEDEGYDIETAKDGEEALEKIRLENPALVILDLLMPHTDGFTVIDMLQDHHFEHPPGIPVIVLTSVREEVSNRRFEMKTGHHMSYNAYFEKPADYDELLHTIHSLIGSEK